MKLIYTSDLHYESIEQEGMITHAKFINRQEPDIVVLGGDIGYPVYNFDRCLQLFREYVNCKIGVILGNHDIWAYKQFTTNSLWEEHLPELIYDYGFTYLENDIIFINNIAIIGSIAWYDYSAAVLPHPFPNDYFWVNKARNNYDGEKMDWNITDIDFASERRTNLESKIKYAKSKGYRIVICTHVPILEEQMWRIPGNRDWEFSNAYFGNLTTGRMVMDYSPEAVLSGHTHKARNGFIGNTIYGTCGADYGRPRIIEIEV